MKSTHIDNTFTLQAIQRSTSEANKYIAEHEASSGRLPPGLAFETLPLARLQLMLETARQRLSWHFSVSDIVALIDCYQGYVFVPDRFSEMASDFCDNFDVDMNGRESSEYRALIEKLDALDLFLKVALADVLEQAWKRDIKSRPAIAKFFMERGIRLF